MFPSPRRKPSKLKKKIPQSKRAAAFLSDSHPRLKELIEKVGPPKLTYNTENSVFQALASAITHQQLHGRAAETILGRFVALFDGPFPEPAEVVKAKVELLMTCGLSRAKASAILDLAAKVLDGTVPTRAESETMESDVLIERITQVKGVGRWTVEMFLIFTLGRPDIFPVHDFGVRKGFAVVFKKRKFPTPKDLEKHGKKWSPHRSTLAWYLWRAADMK